MEKAGGGLKIRKSKVKQGSARNEYLDVLKGFTILLVVLGHSTQAFTANFDSNLLFRLIYSFHMPLFMFLSGAVAAYSLRPTGWDFLKKKFYVLVIPFVAWYLLGYLLEGTYHHVQFAVYINRWVISPDWGLWFLWVLFLNFCMLALAKKLQPFISIASFLLIWAIIYFEPIGKYGVGMVRWYLPFFFVGYLVFFYRDKLKKFGRPTLLACIIAYPILFAYWYRIVDPSFALPYHMWLINHHIHDVYRLTMLAYSYGVPFSGIGLVYWLLKAVGSRYLYAILGWIGLYTMDIYVSHQYFLRYAFGDHWVRILTGFVIAPTISLALSILVLRRNNLLNRIFLGGRDARDSPEKLGKSSVVWARKLVTRAFTGS